MLYPDFEWVGLSVRPRVFRCAGVLLATDIYVLENKIYEGNAKCKVNPLLNVPDMLTSDDLSFPSTRKCVQDVNY